MFLLLVLIKFFLLFTHCKSEKYKFKELNYETPLTRAVEDYIVNFYYPFGMRLNIFRESSSKSDYIQDSDLINHALLSSGAKIDLVLENTDNVTTTDYKRIMNLIFVDDFESFFRFFHNTESDDFDMQGFYLIVFCQPVKNFQNILETLFKRMWEYFAANVNVIISYDSEEAFVYTYFPYTHLHCERIHPVLLGTYSITGKTSEFEYFPKKVHNLFKCPLNIAINEVPPVLSVNKMENGTILTDGPDSILLYYLANKMNFTPILLTSTERFGVIFPNGTSTGPMNLVQTLKANLTIGFYTTSQIRDSIMTGSYNFYSSDLIWIVPPGRSFTSFEKLFKPFNSRLWITVVVTFTTSCVLIAVWRWKFRDFWIFAFEKNSRNPYFDLFIGLFGGVIVREPFKNFARILLMSYLLYTLVIRGAYQGALFQFMKSESLYPQVETIREMVDRGYNFYMTSAGLVVSEGITEIQGR